MQNATIEVFGMSIWFLFSIIFFGMRNETIGTDTAAYIQHAQAFENTRQFDSTFDVGYNLLVSAIVDLLGANHILVVIECIFLTLIFVTCKYWFGDHSLLGLLGFISVFSYYGLAINIIRSGLAIGFWLCGLYCCQWKHGRLKCIVFYALAVSLHSAILIPIGISLVSRLFPNKFTLSLIPAAVLFVLAFPEAVVAALLHFRKILLIGKFVDNYVGQQIEYRTGFRYDFLAYCLVLLFVMLFGIARLHANIVRLDVRRNSDRRLASNLVNIYALLVTCFVMVFGLPYSDRIGLFAFILAPLNITFVWLSLWRSRGSWKIIPSLWIFFCLHFVLTLTIIEI